MNHHCGQDGGHCHVCNCHPCSCCHHQDNHCSDKKQHHRLWIETMLDVRKKMQEAMNETDMAQRDTKMKHAIQQEISFYENILNKPYFEEH